MGITDIGEFKSYSMTRFKGILALTVRNSLKTQSPIPEWAAEKVKESWNVGVKFNFRRVGLYTLRSAYGSAAGVGLLHRFILGVFAATS
jgi:hypothetical protein